MVLFGACGTASPARGRSEFTEKYLSSYRAGSGLWFEDLDEWLLICAAARICVDSPDTEQLLTYVRGRLQS